jgi:hypothetical protein
MFTSLPFCTTSLRCLSGRNLDIQRNRRTVLYDQQCLTTAPARAPQ